MGTKELERLRNARHGAAKNKDNRMLSVHAISIDSYGKTDNPSCFARAHAPDHASGRGKRLTSWLT